MLAPGSELVARAGGIHRFMRWDGLVLSDSGGYQVYSLIHKNPEMGRVTEEGVEFRSVLDGSKHFLTPEKSIQIQFDLGVDMMVVLDDPRPNGVPEEEINLAVERTIRWAKRCREEYDRQVRSRGLTKETRPFLFGVVQGGKSRELRKKCVEGLISLNFDGYGFGARHIDEDGTFLEDIVRYTAEILPEDKLRFALGVGTPEDIVRFWECGWDMFDCVIPTREGRHGRLFLRRNNLQVTGYRLQVTGENSFYETINIGNGKFREDFGVIEEGCACPSCAGGYTRAYIHHLFSVGESLGGQLATLHNLFFYNTFMQRLRDGER
jgi:queuine tRNA-ribosyltransferase